MSVCDTSIIVPALTAWHEAHEACWKALQEPNVRPAAHAVLEAFSVLTRLPEPQRVSPVVAEALLGSLAAPVPAPSDSREVVTTLARAGVAGGAAYDGLIALTSLAAGLPLLTRDARALPTYRRLGAAITLVS
ncbi:MAG: PIN domain-containing protein [Solirubrobacterales bacterium]|nr:PIN domain-containing protein [Solirubrobacterales bacterium]